MVTAHMFRSRKTKIANILINKIILLEFGIGVGNGMPEPDILVPLVTFLKVIDLCYSGAH